MMLRPLSLVFVLIPFLCRSFTAPRPALKLSSKQLVPQSILTSRISPLWLAEDAAAESPRDTTRNETSSEVIDQSSKKTSGRTWFGFGKITEKDGLTFRQKLKKAGMNVVLSYGWVSNMSYGVSMSIAWYIFSKSTGLSPLAKGQWKPFLGVYAGFYIFNNIIRPVRFAASVAIAPYFERLIGQVQERTKLGRGWSLGLTIFLVNVVGTLSLLSLGVSLASIASGVPAIPLKAA